MAKIVTLKNPNDEDIYPVTDASGIRVTGNITLQQALDGFVYADDPTTPANPDGWITPNDIDWSTFTYSTSEQRVGTWINGKPVYKKTVNTGTMPNNARKQVAHGISNLDFIISMSGAAYGSSTFVPIPYADTTASSNIGLFVGSGDIIIFTGSNFSYLTTSYVTLYYTKTTD